MKGETPVNSTMSIGQARKMVEQLKIEASMCRIKVGGPGGTPRSGGVTPLWGSDRLPRPQPRCRRRRPSC